MSYMIDKRICLHFWRRQEGWWSHTRQDEVLACSPCRKRWAASKLGKVR